MDDVYLKELLRMQKNEITEHLIYTKIASILKKNDPNKAVLIKVANDELRHYKSILEITKVKVKPDKVKVYFYYFLSIIFGLSFGLKLMESGESIAESNRWEKVLRKCTGSDPLCPDLRHPSQG